MRHLSVIFIILNITVRIALKNLNCYKIHINLFPYRVDKPSDSHASNAAQNGRVEDGSVDSPVIAPFPASRSKRIARFCRHAFQTDSPRFRTPSSGMEEKAERRRRRCVRGMREKMARNKSLMPADRRQKRDRGQDACRQVHSDMYAKANGMRRNEEAVRRWGAAAAWKEFHTRKQRGTRPAGDARFIR